MTAIRPAVLCAALTALLGCQSIGVGDLHPHKHCGADKERPKSPGSVLVEGLVKSPGAQRIPPRGVTLADALLIAGDVDVPKNIESEHLFVCLARRDVTHCIALPLARSEESFGMLNLQAGDLVDVVAWSASPFFAFAKLHDGDVIADNGKLLAYFGKRHPGQKQFDLKLKLLNDGQEMRAAAMKVDLEKPPFSVISGALSQYSGEQVAGRIVVLSRTIDGRAYELILPIGEMTSNKNLPNRIMLTRTSLLDDDVVDVTAPMLTPLMLERFVAPLAADKVKRCLRRVRSSPS